MNTNCKNCGAPLSGGKCDYCGTEYGAKAPELTVMSEGVTIYCEDSPGGQTVVIRSDKDRERIFIPAYRIADFFGI